MYYNINYWTLLERRQIIITTKSFLKLSSSHSVQLVQLAIPEIEASVWAHFLAHELLSWAGLFQMVSWAEPSFFRFWIWRAELSRAFSDFEFGELSWAELSSSRTSQKMSSNWSFNFRYSELNELHTVTTNKLKKWFGGYYHLPSFKQDLIVYVKMPQ